MENTTKKGNPQIIKHTTIERLDDLPAPVRERILRTFKEVDDITEESLAFQKTNLSGGISLTYEHGAPTDLLTPFERAQSVCFVTRYEQLPTLESFDIIENNGKFFLGNISFMRHILNEYRSIVANERDSIHYSKIHNWCHLKLSNRDYRTGLCISVEHEKDGIITDTFIKVLGERNKSIKFILNRCEYDYIYNGILQHSDHKYTTRFWQEYSSGKINHLFIKHAFLLGVIKDYMFSHYKMLSELTFPKMGPI